MGGNNANLLQDIRVSKHKLNTSSQSLTQAHAAFTIHSDEFLALVEQLDTKFQELEVRETVVEKRENEMRDKTQQLQERETKCAAREQKVEARERDVAEKEAKWNETEKRMQQNAAKYPNLVQLSIGGTRFTVSKEKLLQHKGSLFEEILVSDHPQSPSSGKARSFLLYSRFPLPVNGTIIKVPSDSAEREAITDEFLHYKIPCKLPDLSFLPRIAIVLWGDLVNDRKYGDKIKEWIPGKRFQLLYKASTDGFGSVDFHRVCDNKGATLTVIRSSNGYLFGGYTPLSWDSSNTSKNSTEGFIFTLANPHNIPCTKYTRNQQNPTAIQCHVTFGPVFGNNGHDISVRDNCHQNTNSFTNFPNAYIDTTGKAKTTFTGEYQIMINEIEVFSVV